MPPTTYYATLEEMLNFPQLLIELELKFPKLAAIKIVPPLEWINLIHFTELSKEFNMISVVKYQTCKQEAEGIFRLGNNPHTDKNIAKNNTKKYKNKLSLEVKLQHTLLFS